VLRKGPEDVPGSWLIFFMTVGLMVFATVSANLMIDAGGEQNYAITILSSLLGLMFYAAVLFVTGFSRRFLPTLTAIIGCSSLLTMMFVAEFVLFQPFLGSQLAGIIATLIIFWSVPVEGHIIARAIERHWFIGIAIAMTVFIVQLGLQSAFSQQV